MQTQSVRLCPSIAWVWPHSCRPATVDANDSQEASSKGGLSLLYKHLVPIHALLQALLLDFSGGSVVIVAGVLHSWLHQAENDIRSAMVL